jgi:hypothetical protein
MGRAALALVLAFVALGIAACGGPSDADEAADAQVVEVVNIDQVASAFDEDRGKPRLVLLLSPT